MADKKPIYAGVDGNKRFLYAKEFGGDYSIDSKKISYDTVGNNHLVDNNVSDNLDTVDEKINIWQTNTDLGASYPILHVYCYNITPLIYPCGTNITIPYDYIRRDTITGFNTTTHEYTIPVDGYYDIKVGSQISPGANTSHLIGLRLLVDGVFKTAGEQRIAYNPSTNASNWAYIIHPTLSTIEYLTAGQTVSIAWYRTELVDYPCVTNQALTLYQPGAATEFLWVTLLWQ